MKDWMKELARHYEYTRNRFPCDRLMILFDIDGTIIDMRHVILHVLNRCDEAGGTTRFRDLTVEDVDVHEEQVEDLLTRMAIPPEERRILLDRFDKMLWQSAIAIEGHEPFPGVFDVIKWFQDQSRTFVGLNTGRPEVLREVTLRAVNRLGTTHGVSFPGPYLFMRPPELDGNIRQGKVEGVRHFTGQGYRVFAMIDNEPENLQILAEEDKDHEILLLHADTIFKSPLHMIPPRSITGKIYDLSRLKEEWEMFRRVLTGQGAGSVLPLGAPAT